MISRLRGMVVARHGAALVVEVGGVVRAWQLVQPEDRLHHPLHLALVGAAVAAHRLLDRGGCVFSAGDAGGRRGDEHDSPGLTDGECDAGVGADVRLLQGDGIRRVLRDQLLDAREDREQPLLQALGARRSPPPVARGPEAPSAFVDDSVPACSRPWVDAENLHGNTLGVPSDVPPPFPRHAEWSPALSYDVYLMPAALAGADPEAAYLRLLEDEEAEAAPEAPTPELEAVAG